MVEVQPRNRHRMKARFSIPVTGLRKLGVRYAASTAASGLGVEGNEVETHA